ncbi:MAG: hypothetical protein QF441_01145 [Bacteriovoracaceae bacterium]|jgi:hypothetical protein|nr:hypothetical protein [Halobacteriovoraceae bacterium]MDP7319176.1 hypothetical protein [Bacteriovoracaceae bacterium]
MKAIVFIFLSLGTLVCFSQEKVDENVEKKEILKQKKEQELLKARYHKKRYIQNYMKKGRFSEK